LGWDEEGDLKLDRKEKRCRRETERNRRTDFDIM
jgi:hypothetical protein